jgi:hypothetical protein
VRLYGASQGLIREAQLGGNTPTVMFNNGDVMSGTPVTAVDSKIGDGTSRVVWTTNTGAIDAALDTGTFLPEVHTFPAGSAIPGSAVSAVVIKPGQVSLFWTQSDGSIWSAYFDCSSPTACSLSNGSWSNAFQLESGAGAPPGSPVTAASSRPGEVRLFWTRADGSIWTKLWYAGWGNAQPIYGPGSPQQGERAHPGQAIAAASTTPSGMSIFWVGQDNSIQSGYYEADPRLGAGWHGSFAIASPAHSFANPNTVISAMPNIGGVDRQVTIFWEGAGATTMSAFYPGGLGQSWSGAGSIAPPGAMVP